MTNEKPISAMSKIINKKIYIGSYVGLKNSHKKAEVKAYRNKNSNAYHFVITTFESQGIEYKQSCIINSPYVCMLADNLGSEYEHLNNQDALSEYWKNQGLNLDNILTIGF